LSFLNCRLKEQWDNRTIEDSETDSGSADKADGSARSVHAGLDGEEERESVVGNEYRGFAADEYLDSVPVVPEPEESDESSVGEGAAAAAVCSAKHIYFPENEEDSDDERFAEDLAAEIMRQQKKMLPSCPNDNDNVDNHTQTRRRRHEGENEDIFIDAEMLMVGACHPQDVVSDGGSVSGPSSVSQAARTQSTGSLDSAPQPHKKLKRTFQTLRPSDLNGERLSTISSISESIFGCSHNQHHYDEPLETTGTSFDPALTDCQESPLAGGDVMSAALPKRKHHLFSSQSRLSSAFPKVEITEDALYPTFREGHLFSDKSDHIDDRRNAVPVSFESSGGHGSLDDDVDGFKRKRNRKSTTPLRLEQSHDGFQAPGVGLRNRVIKEALTGTEDDEAGLEAVFATGKRKFSDASVEGEEGEALGDELHDSRGVAEQARGLHEGRNQVQQTISLVDDD
jgi:hypothetical protein